MASTVEKHSERLVETDDLIDSSRTTSTPAADDLNTMTTSQIPCAKDDDQSLLMSSYDRYRVDDVGHGENGDAVPDGIPDHSSYLVQQGWGERRGIRTDSPIADDREAARNVIRLEGTQTCSESAFNTDEYRNYELPKRILRPQLKTRQTFALPRFDNDSSDETYDPQGRASRRQVRRKSSHRPRHHAYYTRNTETGEIFAIAAADDVCYVPMETDTLRSETLVVTLRFPSEAGKNNFSMQTNDRSEHNENELKGYSLRRRPAVTKSNSAAAALTSVKQDDSQPDKSYHPVARGCHACAELHLHCSLLEDEISWPCDHCRADQNGCQLITPPVRFKACEACKRRRGACSYTTTRNHTATCQQCVTDRRSCIVGPAKEYTRKRLRYLEVDGEGGWTLPKKQLRSKYWSAPDECVECCSAGRECQYVADSDGLYRVGCTECCSRSVPCTIRDKVKLPVADTGEASAHIHLRTAQSPALQPTLTTRTVGTSFSYPILFNCDNQPKDTASPCLFCIAPDAAIYGFGVRTIRIIDHLDPEKADELSRSKKPTSICTVCTTARMSIISCEKHDMQPIIGIYGDEALLEQFHEDQKDPQSIKELALYCSVCPDMAVYECHAQETLMDATYGCGLKLCETCAMNLDGEHGSSLQQTLASLPTRLPDGTMQLRADCELLRPDGALSRYLAWLTRQS